LDMDVLAALRDLFEERELHDLFDLFLSDTAMVLTTLHTALEDGDTVQLCLAADKLEGSSATIGALDMSRLCLEVQVAVRAHRLDRARALLDRLDEMFE